MASNSKRENNNILQTKNKEDALVLKFSIPGTEMIKYSIKFIESLLNYLIVIYLVGYITEVNLLNKKGQFEYTDFKLRLDLVEQSNLINLFSIPEMQNSSLSCDFPVRSSKYFFVLNQKTKKFERMQFLDKNAKVESGIATEGESSSLQEAQPRKKVKITKTNDCICIVVEGKKRRE